MRQPSPGAAPETAACTALCGEVTLVIVCAGAGFFLETRQNHWLQQLHDVQLLQYRSSRLSDALHGQDRSVPYAVRSLRVFSHLQQDLGLLQCSRAAPASCRLTVHICRGCT